MDINILVRPVYGRQRAQSPGTSDVSNTLCVPMGIRIGRVGLYVGMPNLDTLTVRKPTIANWNAY
jgi:hypothetical protein